MAGPDATSSGELDARLARRLTALTIGMDAFERRTGGGAGALDEEGLVPVFLGRDLVEAEAVASWEEVDAHLARLTDDVAELPDGARRDYLAALVASLAMAARLFRGEVIGYAEKLTTLVGVPAAPVEERVLDGLRDEVDAALAAAGITDGTMAARVRRWQARSVVTPGDLPAVVDELMRAAKARTDATVFDTGDFTMAFAPVRGVPFGARCDFDRGRMELNVDLSFTRPGLKHLVGHEAFPGHATQLLYTAAAAAAGTSPLDVLLCTVNSVTGALQEGIGEQALHLVDGIDDADDRIHEAVRRLRSATQTSVAWHLMEGGWGERRALEALMNDAFGEEAWARGRIEFARHPFRGPFLASYWYGDEAVREVRESGLARDELVRLLFGSLNSVASLRRAAGLGR